MLKSKKITDYFEVSFDLLRPGHPLPFSAHLYFPNNDHILLWLQSGDVLLEKIFEKHRARGVRSIWVHVSEKNIFETYLHPPQPRGGRIEEPPPPQTPEGAKISKLLNSQGPGHEKAAVEIAREAQSVLTRIVQAPPGHESPQREMKHAQKVIEDVLGSALDKTESVLRDLWKTAKLNPEFEHPVNVATYSSLIALSLGRINPQALSDLAMAGLLHDIGISQLAPSVAASPWKSSTAEVRAEYKAHVMATIEILDAFSPASQIPARVKELILQHHEKFDGTGYPRNLQGFKISDLAQLLSIGDLLDAISTGQWDGTERTLSEAFSIIESIEKSRTFPEYFNPEVFSAVFLWAKNAGGRQLSDQASEVVQSQMRKVLTDK